MPAGRHIRRTSNFSVLGGGSCTRSQKQIHKLEIAVNIVRQFTEDPRPTRQNVSKYHVNIVTTTEDEVTCVHLSPDVFNTERICRYVEQSLALVLYNRIMAKIKSEGQSSVRSKVTVRRQRCAAI